MTDVNFEIRFCFCYRIPELLGMANDSRGNNIPLYVKRKYDSELPLSEESYDVHQEEIRKIVAKQFEIDEHYIESISQAEYDKNNIVA